MSRFLSFILSFLLVGISATSATVPLAEHYWNTVLPDTAIPNSIYDLLHPTGDSSSKISERPVSRTRIGYVAGYVEKLNKDQVSPNAFFVEQQLTPGSKLTLAFLPAYSRRTLLPRKTADSIPFSTKDLPSILTRLSINPDSTEAHDMVRTLHACEAPALRNEVKACATSLESMVDFAMSTLQTRDITALSSNLPKNGLPEKEYTISKVKKVGEVANYMACHEDMYPYTVYLCHTMGPTRAYVAAMSAKDGTTIDMVSVCHLDTSGWEPDHVAFQLLNVKPGTVPVCHIMPYGHIFWGAKNKMFNL